MRRKSYTVKGKIQAGSMMVGPAPTLWVHGNGLTPQDGTRQRQITSQTHQTQAFLVKGERKWRPNLPLAACHPPSLHHSKVQHQHISGWGVKGGGAFKKKQEEGEERKEGDGHLCLFDMCRFNREAVGHLNYCTFKTKYHVGSYTVVCTGLRPPQKRPLLIVCSIS